MPEDADSVDGASLTVDEMRFSAEQLRTVMNAIDSGIIEASGSQRAFIAGALQSLKFLTETGGTAARDGSSTGGR